MTIDQHAFRAVLGRFSSGVTVVTTVDKNGDDRGMTVSSFCSVSLEPPLVLICVEHSGSVYQPMADAETFTVNILSEGQEALARRFAGPDPDRFEGLGFSRGGNGNAIFSEVLGYIQCKVVARHPTGDHDILVAEVEEAMAEEGRPLLYYRGGYAQLER
ncbi:MAG TPA: flavin reductase family protein [Gemmatimonadaceae bacterium]|nr:flavin reductase family protein [Gemmatimonadaceae bacterium]